MALLWGRPATESADIISLTTFQASATIKHKKLTSMLIIYTFQSIIPALEVFEL